MIKLSQHSNTIALVAVCWGFLLTCVTFSFIVWTSHPGDDGSKDEYVSLSLFCEISILALGCTQTTLSFVLFLASPKHKRCWTTIWICSHVVIILGLVLFYTIHMYTAGVYSISVSHPPLKSSNDRANSNANEYKESVVADSDTYNATLILNTENVVESDGASSAILYYYNNHRLTRFTSLDASILFDILFLTILFVCILCENPNDTPKPNLTNSNDNACNYNNNLYHRTSFRNSIHSFNRSNNDGNDSERSRRVDIEKERLRTLNFPRNELPITSLSGNVIYNLPAATSDRGQVNHAYEFRQPFRENLI